MRNRLLIGATPSRSTSFVSTMPPYTVKGLETREQMDAVVDVIWKAQYRPYMPSASMLFPVFGYTAEDRARGVSASKDRLWAEHASNPSSSHWIYVEDSATGEIVAGTLWEWRRGSPFANGLPEIDMYWWPEGEAKAFCEEMIRQTMVPRSLWMHRPHGGKDDSRWQGTSLSSVSPRPPQHGRAPGASRPRHWWADDGLG